MLNGNLVIKHDFLSRPVDGEGKPVRGWIISRRNDMAQK